MLRHIRRMKLSYGEGFIELLDGLRELVERGNAHHGATTTYFGIASGPAKDVFMMTDFETVDDFAAWSKRYGSDQVYWDKFRELLASYFHLVEDDTIEMLRTL